MSTSCWWLCARINNLTRDTRVPPWSCDQFVFHFRDPELEGEVNSGKCAWSYRTREICLCSPDAPENRRDKTAARRLVYINYVYEAAPNTARLSLNGFLPSIEPALRCLRSRTWSLRQPSASPVQRQVKIAVNFTSNPVEFAREPRKDSPTFPSRWLRGHESPRRVTSSARANCLDFIQQVVWSTSARKRARKLMYVALLSLLS